MHNIQPHRRRPELWAGFECTLNRIGDEFRDQLQAGELAARRHCLEQLPDLGVRAFRYRVAWDDIRTPVTQFDEDIALLVAGSVRPIIGLLHHGSGPKPTDLLSDDFAQGLAGHAAAVAQRYPDTADWTPVNEPLTTARFSVLYGHWYPHLRSERAFWLALLNQIDATRLAMHEIRKVNPVARLVQTEDLGRTFATHSLADQAAFDNQRRWMTWDLLAGDVVRGHPFYQRLCDFGFGERLAVIADDPCPPDIIGVDHYVTSDRFLDHRLTHYPSVAQGGNQRSAYADVEAVRVLSAPHDGMPAALRDTWERYRIPVAITECHLGCTREQQARWLKCGWEAAGEAIAQGAHIAAVTSWAIGGARDWSSLATQDSGSFESGAFHLHDGEARQNAIARTASALSKGGPPPLAAEGAGWWQVHERLAYPAAPFAAPVRIWSAANLPLPPLLIAGASGTLGKACLAAARARGLKAIATTRSMLDIDSAPSIEAALDRFRPWAVINATGWVRVDEAESDADACMRTNFAGAVRLADACNRRAIPNVNFSSDLVFDGATERPYVESDPTSPLNVYGMSKAKADARVLEMDNVLAIRTAAFFSPDDPYNFAMHAVGTLQSGQPFLASGEHSVTPTYVPHLVDAMLDLLVDDERGLWHLTSGSELSWQAFAGMIASACSLDRQLVSHAEPEQMGWAAMRPRRAGLASTRSAVLPSLENAIDSFASSVGRNVPFQMPLPRLA